MFEVRHFHCLFASISIIENSSCVSDARSQNSKDSEFQRHSMFRPSGLLNTIYRFQIQFELILDRHSKYSMFLVFMFHIFFFLNTVFSFKGVNRNEKPLNGVKKINKKEWDSKK